MPESLDRIINIALENVTWIIFAIFMLSGLFGRSGGKKTASSDPIEPVPREKAADHRPLAERMAEHFGIPLEEIQGKPASNPSPQQPRQGGQRYTSQGRRSTSIGGTQDQYPELFGGGKSIWDDEPADDGWGSNNQQWGFDSTEWGSTFEKNEEQWGGGFAEKKDSTPRIEIG